MARLPYAGNHVNEQPAGESTGAVMQRHKKKALELGGFIYSFIHTHLFYK